MVPQGEDLLMVMEHKKMSFEDVITSSGLPRRGRSLSEAFSRLAAAAVGLVLLAAGIMKATDMGLFIRQITAYGLLTHPVLVTWGAWLMIGVQFGLGIALVLFYRPRATLALTSLLWAGLACLTSWAWLSGATDECGCYGAWLKTTPAQALIENLVFFALTLASWKTYRPKLHQNGKKLAWAVSVACAVGLVLPMLSGFPISAMVRPESSDIMVERVKEVHVSGLRDVDLSRGDYLVVLIGTDCAHCKELLPQLDELAAQKDLPPMIALGKNSEVEIRRFMDEFEPSFSIGRIDEKEFWRLLGNGQMPRILLVQEGKVLKAWDRIVPQKEMIKSTALSQKDKTKSLAEKRC
ncbi:MAG: hypothetical protein JXL84_17525 [Deltaproteobacteria bacterium]|nr:hypothetical protein [Deltaproteobacteria bacterium]